MDFIIGYPVLYRNVGRLHFTGKLIDKLRLKVDRKRGSLVVSELTFSAAGHGFDPRSRRGKKSVSEHVFLSVICMDSTR